MRFPVAEALSSHGDTALLCTLGEVEFIQEKGKELDRQKEAVKALQQKGELSSFYRSMMRLQCFPGKSPLQLAVQDFQLAEVIIMLKPHIPCPS